MTLRPLPAALRTDDHLRTLQQQALWLWQIRQALAEFLPPEWMAQLAAGRYEEGRLTLLSPSGLVVAKLRHMEATIAAELSRRGFPVTAIRWRVRPELATLLAAEQTPVETAAPRSLSAAARAALSELLAQMPADAPLAQALARWLHGSEHEQAVDEKK